MCLLFHTSYAVGVWGGETAPENLLFRPGRATKSPYLGEKRFLGGTPRGYLAFQTSPKNADRVSPVISKPNEVFKLIEKAAKAVS
jgi:hypothetical protein